MRRSDHTDDPPNGYAWHASSLLVPRLLNNQLISEAINKSAPNVTRRTNAPLPPPPVPSPMVIAAPKKITNQIQVYRESEVQRLERGLESLSKTSDRRRASEALLKVLKEQTPVGYRSYGRVPRNFCQRLDALESAMPNFRQVIGQIQLLLTLEKAGRNLLRLPPLLLAGDPGVGKTFFAMEFAKAMGLECHVVHMENATSGMLLTGLEQFYATASPGMVFDALVKGHNANPVLVVDELDKASTYSRQPPGNALYQLLESNTARQFRDQSCLDLALDASHINWIVTANNLGAISLPLLSRMTVVHVPSPTSRERIQIAKQVYRDLRSKNVWGRRFEATLPEKSADLLATLPGSVRRMQSVLRIAFAHALSRKSTVVEVRDLHQVLRSELPFVSLEDIPSQGQA